MCILCQRGRPPKLVVSKDYRANQRTDWKPNGSEAKKAPGNPICFDTSEKLTMRHLLDTTELLVASWILGGGGDRIPTSHGILDRALKTAVEHESCPNWVRDQLHFVDSRIGLQCVELPALLDWAQRAQLTTAPNPSYQSTQVQISRNAARQILSDLAVSEEEAVKWGELLQSAVDEASSSMSAFPEPAIEEY